MENSIWSAIVLAYACIKELAMLVERVHTDITMLAVFLMMVKLYHAYKAYAVCLSDLLFRFLINLQAELIYDTIFVWNRFLLSEAWVLEKKTS